MRGGPALAAVAILLLPSVLADTTGLHGELPSARDGAAVVWTGREAYLFGGGGGDGPTATLDEIVRYDPANGTFQTMAARLPFPVKLASAAWDGRYAYVFGGKISTDLYSADIVRYDPSNDSVERMRAKLPTPRFGTGAVWLDGAAYVVGGRLASGLDLDQIVRIDPAADTVSTRPATLPGGGYNAAVATDGQRVFVFGGSRLNARTDAVASYDPDTDRTSLQRARLPHPTMGIRAALVPGQGIFLFGGSDAQTLAGTRLALRYNVTSDAIAPLPVALPVAMRDAAVFSDGRDAYAVGGADGFDTLRIAQRYLLPRAPVAAFDARVENLTVHLDATASSDIDGSIVRYAWDLGDAGNATGATATHVFAAPGEYNITLTVTDNEGLTANATRAVRVRAFDAPPLAAFNATVSGLHVAANASASSDLEGALASYAWDWGDGTSGEGVLATHRFAVAGNYTVRLTVVDAAGQNATTTRLVTILPPNGPPATFSVDTNGLIATARYHGEAPPGWTWRWTWGDGATGEGPEAAHEYATSGAFRVGLVVADANGNESVATREIVVDRAPSAWLSVNIDGLAVVFDGTASSDPDGDPLEYAWTFGDGAELRGLAQATHAYAEPGSFVVTLTVTDPYGALDTFSTRVEIGAAEAPASPEPSPSPSEPPIVDATPPTPVASPPAGPTPGDLLAGDTTAAEATQAETPGLALAAPLALLGAALLLRRFHRQP